MIRTSIVSSMVKVFPDSHIDDFAPLHDISVLRGERLSVQFLLAYEGDDEKRLSLPIRLPMKTEGELFRYASMRTVAYVGVTKPLVSGTCPDDNYERTAPGLFPDVLRPMYYGGKLTLSDALVGSTWVEFDLPEDVPAGDYTLTFGTEDPAEGGLGSSRSLLHVHIIDAVLPEADFHMTQWFHTDCLANYYHVEVWSEEHFRIVENFIRTFVRGGNNTLLTPVFTPPLDTAIGGERRTTQLVGVKKEGDVYSFDFSLLDRWIDIADRCGVKCFEISHLFTQWGAAHAPKIMATVDGTYRRLFGWETNSIGEEYITFLRTFLAAFLKHMKARGDDKRCLFHISDEPSMMHLDTYRTARSAIADLLEGYHVMDALSKFEFYGTGAIEHPIPSTNHIEAFLDAKVPDLWTYYCVCQWEHVSNRFQSMPACRNRSIGMQFFKYNIKGFLQWGYNFYNNQYSGDAVNPYIEQSADDAFPAGDAFSVYPASDGTALESMRYVVFYEALQDMRAMQLAASFVGKDAVIAAIEEVFGTCVTFNTCAKSPDTILAIRQRINDIIRLNSQT